ncbi:MAG: hypothetical protein Q8N98_02400 [bacterium]|nr:hypothetical protein [bacterium]
MRDSQAEATVFHRKIEEAGVLTPPTPYVFDRLRACAGGVKERLESDSPDAIVTIGGSSIVSRLLLRAGDDKLSLPQFRIERETNALMYKGGYPEEINEADWLRQIRMAFVQIGLTPDLRVVIVDDYASSGVKISTALLRMAQLGYANTKFCLFVGDLGINFSDTVFTQRILSFPRQQSYFTEAFKLYDSGQIKIDFKEAVFIASRDLQLLAYLSRLSDLVSETKYELYEKSQVRADEAVRAELKDDVTKLLRIISQALA